MSVPSRAVRHPPSGRRSPRGGACRSSAPSGRERVRRHLVEVRMEPVPRRSHDPRSVDVDSHDSSGDGTSKQGPPGRPRVLGPGRSTVGGRCEACRGLVTRASAPAVERGRRRREHPPARTAGAPAPGDLPAGRLRGGCGHAGDRRRGGHRRDARAGRRRRTAHARRPRCSRRSHRPPGAPRADRPQPGARQGRPRRAHRPDRDSGAAGPHRSQHVARDRGPRTNSSKGSTSTPW